MKKEDFLKKLEQSNKTADKILLSFAKTRNLTNVKEIRNRGDLFESCITGINCKNSGLHTISNGDYKGLELKYITTSTGASSAMKGTICKQHLIGFNNGKSIEIRLIDTSDLQGKENNSGRKRGDRLTYDLNHNKGKVVAIYTIENGLQGAIA